MILCLAGCLFLVLAVASPAIDVTGPWALLAIAASALFAATAIHVAIGRVRGRLVLRKIRRAYFREIGWSEYGSD